MLSRRTRARLDFLANAFFLAFQVVARRKAARIGRRHRSGELESLDVEERYEDGDGLERDTLWIAWTDTMREEGELAPIRLEWVIVGIVRAVGMRTLIDHDVAGVRRSYRRRAMLGVANAIVWTPLEFGNPDRSNSMGIGVSIGAVCYRLRYGVLGELRGE